MAGLIATSNAAMSESMPMSRVAGSAMGLRGRREEGGVVFHKKPDEGGMKGLAFCLDPDGYWIEIIKRGQAGDFNA